MVKTKIKNLCQNNKGKIIIILSVIMAIGVIQIGNFTIKEDKMKVICVSCKRKVKVKLVRYGDGHIAVCPKCKRLAYNGKWMSLAVLKKNCHLITYNYNK